MKTVCLLLMFLQAPKPSPTPELTWATTGTIANLRTIPSSVTFPRMVIHTTGDVLLEINSEDGKHHLTVMANGEVKGDMPHDKAADAFWKSLAAEFPSMCAKEKQ